MFSKDKIQKIEIQKILEKCKKGDYIIVLTVNNEFALSHNKILVF